MFMTCIARWCKPLYVSHAGTDYGKSGDLSTFFPAGVKKGGGKITGVALVTGGSLPRTILKSYASGASDFPGTTSGGLQSNGPTPVRSRITTKYTFSPLISDLY
jgi:hypothetical protein